jgi:hypothetical protein
VGGLVLTGSRVTSPFADDRATRRWRWMLAAGVTPSVLTLIYEWTTGATPVNATRALAGAAAGIVVAALVWATLADSRRSGGNQVH